jgi:hypothetical protein
MLNFEVDNMCDIVEYGLGPSNEESENQGLVWGCCVLYRHTVEKYCHSLDF